MWAKSHPPLAFLFRWVPVPFYCYFIPTCLTAMGLLPSTSALYGATARFLLPLCLALFLISVDISALKGVGRPALVALVWGMVGIVVGLVGAYGVFHGHLPAESWKSVGALAGSWTGGSANLIAVKESLEAPENVFSPILLVDTLFAYSWMAFLVWGAGRQAEVDRWTKVFPRGAGPLCSPALRRWPRGDGGIPVQPTESATSDCVPKGQGSPTSWSWGVVLFTAMGMAVVSIGFGTVMGPRLSQWISCVWPTLGASFKPVTWTVIAVTTGSLLMAYSGRCRARSERTEQLGTAFLFFLLTTLGAQASFGALGNAPAFLAVGAVALIIHGLILAVGARLCGLPLSLLATASQACVGGVVSAPLVGAVYHPALAAVGLLLAVIGNVVGTYVGLMTAHLCLWVGQ
ncbi:MAG: DUF819 family protein [Elusimicrobia bacterium]|nr:DUF819 family protein [Elusimicrobiota bacterium]